MNLDLYPVKTKADAGQLRNLRMRSRDSGTVVWQLDKETGEVSEFMRSESVPERDGATQNWRVGAYVFELQRGCGCNHPMYTWVPPDDG